MYQKNKCLVKRFFKNYKDDFLVLLLSFVLGIISLVTFSRLVYEVITTPQKGFIDFIYHFTSESNIIVLIVMILFFTSFRKSSYFTYFAFIALISILFTSIINHIVLDKNEIYKFNFKDALHYRHTIIPLLYTIFYFLSKEIYVIPFKQIYIGLLHPLFYFLFFCIRGLIFGAKNIKYPYSFMNPTQPGIFQVQDGQGYSYLFLVVILLGFFLYIYAYILVLIKKKFF